MILLKSKALYMPASRWEKVSYFYCTDGIGLKMFPFLKTSIFIIGLERINPLFLQCSEAILVIEVFIFLVNTPS